MRYIKPKSIVERQKHFHSRAKKAADTLAGETSCIVQLEENEDANIMIAQIRVFLCTLYGYSANGSGDLIDKYLQVSIPEKYTCTSTHLYV